MSNIRSCGSLSSGNDALLKVKGEMLSKEDRDERVRQLELKKQVGSLQIPSFSIMELFMPTGLEFASDHDAWIYTEPNHTSRTKAKVKDMFDISIEPKALV